MEKKIIIKEKLTLFKKIRKKCVPIQDGNSFDKITNIQDITILLSRFLAMTNSFTTKNFLKISGKSGTRRNLRSITFFKTKC